MDKNNFIEEDKYIRAKKKVQRIKGFYGHLGVYIIVNLFLAIMGGMHGGLYGFLEPIKTTGFFWGIGLVFHWYGVFGKEIFFGKDWEQRKIKEYMDKDNFNKL